MSLIVTGVVGALGVGASAYEASSANSISSKELGLAESQASEQAYYNKQLQQLIANPSSFLGSSLFQSTLNQGLGAVQRTMAAQGYAGSGNEAAELEQYGQNFASGQLQSQESLLASLTGLGSNPASAFSAAGSSQASSASMLSGGLNTAALMALLLQRQGDGESGLTPADLGINLNPSLDQPDFGPLLGPLGR